MIPGVELARTRPIATIPDVPPAFAHDPTLVALAPRQRVEHLIAITPGITRAELARGLALSETTVESHLRTLRAQERVGMVLRNRLSTFVPGPNAGAAEPMTEPEKRVRKPKRKPRGVSHQVADAAARICRTRWCVVCSSEQPANRVKRRQRAGVTVLECTRCTEKRSARRRTPAERKRA